MGLIVEDEENKHDREKFQMLEPVYHVENPRPFISPPPPTYLIWSCYGIFMQYSHTEIPYIFMKTSVT